MFGLSTPFRKGASNCPICIVPMSKARRTLKVDYYSTGYLVSVQVLRCEECGYEAILPGYARIMPAAGKDAQGNGSEGWIPATTAEKEEVAPYKQQGAGPTDPGAGKDSGGMGPAPLTGGSTGTEGISDKGKKGTPCMEARPSDCSPDEGNDEEGGGKAGEKPIKAAQAPAPEEESREAEDTGRQDATDKEDDADHDGKMPPMGDALKPAGKRKEMPAAGTEKKAPDKGRPAKDLEGSPPGHKAVAGEPSTDRKEIAANLQAPRSDGIISPARQDAGESSGSAPGKTSSEGKRPSAMKREEAPGTGERAPSAEDIGREAAKYRKEKNRRENERKEPTGSPPCMTPGAKGNPDGLPMQHDVRIGEDVRALLGVAMPGKGRDGSPGRNEGRRDGGAKEGRQAPPEPGTPQRAEKGQRGQAREVNAGQKAAPDPMSFGSRPAEGGLPGSIPSGFRPLSGMSAASFQTLASLKASALRQEGRKEETAAQAQTAAQATGAKTVSSAGARDTKKNDRKPLSAEKPKPQPPGKDTSGSPQRMTEAKTEEKSADNENSTDPDVLKDTGDPPREPGGDKKPTDGGMDGCQVADGMPDTEGAADAGTGKKAAAPASDAGGEPEGSSMPPEDKAPAKDGEEAAPAGSQKEENRKEKQQENGPVGKEADGPVSDAAEGIRKQASEMTQKIAERLPEKVVESIPILSQASARAKRTLFMSEERKFLEAYVPHKRVIISDLIYDTDESEMFLRMKGSYGFDSPCMHYNYRTKNGNFFRCTVKYRQEDTIRVLDAIEVKRMLETYPDLYRRFFPDAVSDA